MSVRTLSEGKAAGFEFTYSRFSPLQVSRAEALEPLIFKPTVRLGNDSILMHRVFNLLQFRYKCFKPGDTKLMHLDNKMLINSRAAI